MLFDFFFRNRIIKRFLLCAVVALSLAACSSVDCSLNGTVLCHYALQTADGEAATLVYPLSVTFNRRTEFGDTVYIDRLKDASMIDLPMSYDSDIDDITLTLYIDSTHTVSDEIHVTKTNEPYFESVDCAPRYNHVLQEVTHTTNFIKEVIISNPEVKNNVTDTNILIRIADAD